MVSHVLHYRSSYEIQRWINNENKLKSNDEYKQWLRNNRHLLIPEIKNKNLTIFNELENNPLRFLKFMLYMNNKLEKINDEIKEWEKRHWKMKRRPPSSAIT